MSQSSQTPTYADVIQHFNDASAFATRYQQAGRRYPLLHRALQHFIQHVATLLKLPAIDKLVFVVSVPLHLATAIFEAVQLSPILEGIVFGQDAHTPFEQRVLASLTICTLLGSSLLAGYCFSKISNRKDAVVPGKHHLSVGWLSAGIILALLYVGSISWVIYKTTAEDATYDTLYFLVLISVMEIALSAAAVVGYTILWQFGQVQWMKFKFEQAEQQMYHFTEKCAQSFRYYRLSLALYNSQQNQNIPCIDTPAIAEAISFHEGHFRPRLD